MPPFIEQSLNKVKGLWTGSSISQRIFVGGLSLTVIAAFFLMLFWLNRPNYKVLYSKLAREDASRVVEKLKAAKEPYKLEDEGQSILVPDEKVYDLRLKLAGDGVLMGQGIGFEIFDELKVGQTDFVQKINYQRALQGELSRTISEFPEIERARVHLVIPNKSLFLEEQATPTASIVLKMREGKKLDQGKLEAIVNLVALSVEGLSKSKITVTDTLGKSIYAPTDDKSAEGLTTNQADFRQTLQGGLERRIMEMLTPVIGPNRVIAKVNADLDFSKKTISKEVFDPKSAVVRSEQRSEDSTQGQANTEAGVPEANFRGDGIAGAVSKQQTTRETRATNYEINKETQNIVSAQGDVKRLSVAVIVDGAYEKDAATGEYAFVPRSDEEMKRLRQLVQSAVGYDQTRGDQIEVSSISFGGPDIEPEPSLTRTITEYASRLGKPVLNALLIFLFLVMVVRPVILALIRPRVQGEVVEGLEGLPQGEERLALIEAAAEEDELEAMESVKKIEDVKAHALQMSEHNMEQAVSILRTWIRQEEAVRA